VDSISITANGSLEIREATYLLRDSAVDASFPAKYHRYVLHPGDEIEGKDSRIVDVANAVWTAEVVAAFKTGKVEMEPTEPRPSI
ncbi:MAG: hypothetical protein QOK23_102, partial [Gammaproteobacteria bacterium]|nr:hypothetical protein [Gammaproteobacteria bacterium]